MKIIYYIVDYYNVNSNKAWSLKIYEDCIRIKVITPLLTKLKYTPKDKS